MSASPLTNPRDMKVCTTGRGPGAVIPVDYVDFRLADSQLGSPLSILPPPNAQRKRRPGSAVLAGVLSWILTTKNFAGSVWLAFADTVCSSSRAS